MVCPLLSAPTAWGLESQKTSELNRHDFNRRVISNDYALEVEICIMKQRPLPPNTCPTKDAKDDVAKCIADATRRRDEKWAQEHIRHMDVMTQLNTPSNTRKGAELGNSLCSF